MKRNPHSLPGTLRAWGTLVRLPNLLTVPGDPLAGYLLARMDGAGAATGAAACALCASLFLYAAGLIANDRADIEQDRRTRPERPLPSGAVSPRAASAGALACTAIGLVFAALAGPMVAVLAGGLVLCIAFYTFSGKSFPVIGPLWMGGCRAFSLLLGAGIAGSHIGLRPAVAAAGLLVYVSSVTALARFETGSRRPGCRLWLPLFALGLGYGAVVLFVGWSLWASVLAGVSLGWTVARTARARVGTAAETGALVGGLIRGLLLFQAVLLATTPAAGRFWIAALPVFWLLHARLAKIFSPS